MRPLKTDLSVYSKFDFERTPVGINYFFHKPEGIEKLDKQVGLCEMVKEAQQRGKPFYITKDEENCIGKFFLGMRDETAPRRSDGGVLGVKLQIFQDRRANLRLRTFVPHFDSGTVNYVVYSPIDKLQFEPDLLVFVATPSQAEILMRAMTYSTGEMFESRGTLVGNCASLYIYPYLSGKVNYMVTGLSYGMNGRRVYPEGLLIISIPYQWIPTITQNLKEMKWVPPGYEIGSREEFVEWDAQITNETRSESENP
jgi:uncharacterized protein (DUF169 family)